MEKMGMEKIMIFDKPPSVTDKMEESINESLQQAEALKQSILKKAFAGEVYLRKLLWKGKSI